MGTVRIIGGIYKSRLLKFKDIVDGLRPTPNRVRETLFNWLGQDLGGKACLDLFAGSGALGFEALSRHANYVVMVEKSATAYNDLKNNKEILQASNVDICLQNSLDYMKNCTNSFDIIFLDPPYSSSLLADSLNLIRNINILNKHGIIYIEYQTRPNLIGYEIIKENKASAVSYALIKLV